MSPSTTWLCWLIVSWAIIFSTTAAKVNKTDVFFKILTRAVRRQKKSRQKRRLVQAPQAPFKAPIHSRCCIGGFRETGLALVIVLRCDWPLCDIWFKSYEHFKIKMFLGEASYTGLVQASYRPRTGLVQVPFTGAWKKGGASGAFFHLGALRCQQL